MTFAKVHSALVAGLNGLPMADGRYLTASTELSDMNLASTANLPLLAIKNGSWTADRWSTWESEIHWDIPCELKVIAQAGQSDDAMRYAMQDLMYGVARIGGLPIDESGKVSPYDVDKTLKLAEENKLEFLANRTGPRITNFRVRPDNGMSSPYAVADVTVRVDFIIDYSPEQNFGKVQWVSLGVSPLPSLRDGLPYAPESQDVRAQGAFVKPDTVITLGGPGGPIVDAQDPPIVKDLASLPGGDPRKQIVSIRVEPLTKSLTHPTTFQMIAIASYADASTSNITAGASWASSAAGVATISAGGLVTTVAAGSSTITATFLGLSGTCALTVA